MQTTFHEKFIIDKNGKRTDVVINAKEYEKMLHLLQEAHVLKIIQTGEKEYRSGKLKPIRALSDLDNLHYS